MESRQRMPGGLQGAGRGSGRLRSRDMASLARGCVAATPQRCGVEATETRPGGLEPPTCGFGAIRNLSLRAGPSLRPLRPLEGIGGGRRALRSACPQVGADSCGGIAGAAHPLVSTPSVGEGLSTLPRQRLGSGLPGGTVSAWGFPEVTRFASARSGGVEFHTAPGPGPS